MKNYDNMPRSIEFLKNQLVKLERVIPLPENQNIDISSQIFTKSMLSHKKELLEELKAAEWLESKADIELILDGPSVNDHTVSASLLSKFIDQIQKLRYATAEIATGSTPNRGRFTKKLLNENELLIKAFSPSSFGIHIKYAKDYITHNLLHDNIERPGESLFLSLFSGKDQSNDLDFTSMTPRLHDYYNDFLSLITENNLSTGIRTRNHPFLVKINPEFAKVLKQNIYYNPPILKNVEKEFFIDGILMMGNLKNHTFMIQTDSTTYSGAIVDSGIIGLKLIPLGSNVLAKLSAIFPSEESDKPIYSLLSIERSTS